MTINNSNAVPPGESTEHTPVDGATETAINNAADAFAAQYAADQARGPLKIIRYAVAEAKNKHFHNIDYVIEVSPPLYPKREFEFGVLNNVKWYGDPELTDLVLEVDIEYNYDAVGLATDREVTRTWYYEDGTPNEEVKLTEKIYTINPQDQLDEAIRRRTNNVRQINISLIGMVPILTGGAMTAQQVIESGQAFFSSYDTAENAYVKTGALSLEDAVRNETDPQFDWFDTDATALGISGVTDIRSFIIYQLSMGARTS